MEKFRNHYTTTLGLVGPLKNMVTRVFAHKDRFTGTENYLSDEDLQKLVGHKQKNKILNNAINILLFPAPAIVAAIALALTRKNLLKGFSPNKLLLKIRNGMDYTNGLYMSLGVLFPIFLVKNLSLINAARDKYERFETIFRYALIMPTGWFGDLFFNGNIARGIDKLMSKKYGTPQGTFYEVKKSGKILVHSKPALDIVEEITKKYGPDMGKKFGNIASTIFYSGLLTHSLATASIIVIALSLTRSRVLKDLAIFQEKDAATNKQDRPEPNSFNDFAFFISGLKTSEAESL